jgi:YidC/Oxa1 family membrane protein insertase
VGIFGDIGSFIMTPLYYAISAVLLAWHWVFTQIGLDPEGGLAWALSIIGLTLVIRIALIPLFVKQIKSSRNMQLIQPKVKELQKKYGHDRERLAQETMKLYKDTGTNPFASCLPILLQMPIFFALFRLLDQAAKKGTAHGFLTTELAEDFGKSNIFGKIPISDSFWGARTWGDNPDANGLVMVVALVLVLSMTATTFTTQRQLMSKNMPADALSGPYAQQQKMLLYILPVAFGLGGVAFPIGVLLYWTTSNLWTMGQQFYVIRNNPAPGTPAAVAKEERDKAKALKHGKPLAAEAEPEPEVEKRPAVREQPKKLTKAQRQAQLKAAQKKQAQGKQAQSKQGQKQPPKRQPEQKQQGKQTGGSPEPTTDQNQDKGDTP